MKRILFAALMATVLVGFNSCEKEEEKNVAEEGVGTYDVTMKFFLEKDKQLIKSPDLEDETGMAYVTLDGENLKVDLEGDIIRLVKIKEVSNGFSFDVEDFVTVEDGVTYTMKGYKGFELDGDKTGYDGAYITATKTLEFYYELPREDFYEMIIQSMLEDEDYVAEMGQNGMTTKDIRDAAYVFLKNSYGEYRIVVDIICVKK